MSAGGRTEHMRVAKIATPSVERMGGVMGTEWVSEGKCRDMDSAIFFPSDGIGVQIARRICEDCPVKSPCLEYALADRVDHGVWGGTSERERRRILRSRRMSSMAPSRTIRVGQPS
jgi:WhiB family transcriptional regulator, redox-sensing transcriptional regulator